MRLRRLVAMTLLGVACTTTAVGRVGAANAQGRLPDDASAPEQPGVVVTATSPTDVRFRADAGDVVVPLTPVHPRAAARHGSPALWGLLIGVVAGAALGLKSDLRTGGEGDTGCCVVMIAPLMFGLAGLGIGALAGALTDGDSP
jgi:hypothetical protein